MLQVRFGIVGPIRSLRLGARAEEARKAEDKP